MSDRYLDFTHSSFGKSLAGLLGLPSPPRLKRASAAWAGNVLEDRPVLVGAASGSQLAAPLLAALAGAGAPLRIVPELPGLGVIKTAAAELKLSLLGNPAAESGEARNHALLFDASGLSSPAQLRELYDFYQPQLRGIAGNGRILVVSRAPESREGVAGKTVSTALRGFIRSLAKEVGKNGSTANLLEVQAGADGALDAPLRFFLSEHSAFISGQVLTISPPAKKGPPLPGSLEGKVALVTGAARGIGAAIAATLAREGARVIGVDHPSAEGGLGETMAKLGGVGLALDVTAADAAERIVTEVSGNYGGLDVIVHNAGVTRDKMLRNMPPHFWDLVLNINLNAILQINEGLLKNKGLREGARAVCISSIGGIGGNAGQTNYGATKAGVIGYVEAMAQTFAGQGGAINAVAPGFIETAMTAAMPLGPREIGRRINSLSQGGLPQDIAEAVAFFASPAADGVNGRTLRVCGQNFFGQ
ncbi:3-oxoacyl-[acyl-carrier protein] reductase [Solimonas aquatica]|uniref:3-oxoacyl-[acyl-carrier protein] reductase n=1 Tax=Solimonas aquatica TaxID=489703 RepID=A0A1H9KJA9_9GAMM|nr:3-oxoacyl-ACP reductase [Solimonas aquatica]SEQ99240.1 3-oxoacyl-[acyl-carrier protein] reductase [Solimonas aquatica]